MIEPRQLFAAVIVFKCIAFTVTAQVQESPNLIAVGTNNSSSPWSTLVDVCVIIAPIACVMCFLAPLPTIVRISRDKTVGKLPLLPYSSMISSSFVWLIYGILKGLPSVWGPNTVGLALGAFYFALFVRNCGPEATDLPGTAKQHLHGTIGIVSINLCLAVMGASGVGYATDMIGKEGVVMCIVLFSSPLTVLRSVIATKSAASIPLPFTLATFVNCIAWFVLGWWKAKDFNIYFPNVLGLSCAVAQLVLKGVYGNGTGGAKEELLPSKCSEAGDMMRNQRLLVM